jgi:hypothetical protein
MLIFILKYNIIYKNGIKKESFFYQRAARYEKNFIFFSIKINQSCDVIPLID